MAARVLSTDVHREPPACGVFNGRPLKSTSSRPPFLTKAVESAVLLNGDEVQIGEFPPRVFWTGR